MSPSPSQIPADRLRLYDQLVATNSRAERKGAAMPYTSVNGHMFSFLTEEGVMALRLSDADRQQFLDRYKTSLCERHGTVMKEYVVVPDDLFRKTAKLQKHFEQSLAYVASLKPKPAKKKSAAKKK